MPTWTYLSESEEATARLGTALADAMLRLSESSGIGSALGGAWVIALVGPLGAGKTRLVRAVSVALGAERRLVSSPTFVLVQEYPARLPVFHFDAYRLRDAGEFEELGVEEYFDSEGVCLIEWADRVAEVLPREHLRVEIELAGPESRRFRLTGRGPRDEGLVESVARQLGEPIA
jgi:tRNA threonylcarbamoyladenosine biosynthesis protein TsaE